MNDNKDFKVKLILPCEMEKYNPPNYLAANSLPYGIGVLAAHLRQQDYHVELEDLRVRYNLFRDSLTGKFVKNFRILFSDDSRNFDSCRKLKFIRSGEIKSSIIPFLDKILDSISAQDFNLIGFSILSTCQFDLALMLSKRLKQRTNAKVVVGGSFINLHSQFFYPDIFNFVDYVITGDGRIPLQGLIQYLQGGKSLSQIPNLVYKENGEILSNPKEKYPIEDMPAPDFNGLPIALYRNKHSKAPVVLPYQISRGCISRCSFCTFIDMSGKLEYKSYDKVLRELKQMRDDYHCRKFLFCDEALNNSYEYLDGLCDLFIKDKLNIWWHGHARAGNLDKPLLDKMREAGCIGLAIGIESGSDRILKNMNKGFTIEQASKVFKDGSEAGLKFHVTLMAGYPGETEEDVEKTVDFIKHHKQQIHSAWVYAFTLRYGTNMHSHPERYGIHNLSPLGARPFNFSFDEVNGLTWERKVKQIKSSYNRISRAIFYYNMPFRRKRNFIIFKFLKFFTRPAKKHKKFGHRNQDV